MPLLFLQQNLHPPSSQVPHVQVQRARDAERDGGAEGAEDKPPQGLLQLQEGRNKQKVAMPVLLILHAGGVNAAEQNNSVCQP